MIVGRYAPSPSGRMHVGNLFSYLVSYLLTHQRAKTHNVKASMRLRVEDLDPARSKNATLISSLPILLGLVLAGMEKLFISQNARAHIRLHSAHS